MVADQDGYSLIILGESYIKINITYSSGKWSDPVNFLNSIYNFRCQKYVKKGYMEMTKKIYLETLKKCTRSLHLPLLISQVMWTIIDNTPNSFGFNLDNVISNLEKSTNFLLN